MITRRKFKMKPLTLLIISFLIFSFTYIYQDADWEVPESAKKMKNPVKEDKETLAIGKNLYAKHCKSCHGKNGEGDGTKAEELDTFPGDFTKEEFHSQTDGTLFYKTTNGHDDMPAFDKKIHDAEDRWIVVNYLRTFKN